MKMIALLMMLVASASFAKEAPVDVDCNKMATNAKSFAQLKQTGIATTPAQFAAFIVSPTVQSYPIRSILNYVFDSSDKTPEQIYSTLYGRCVQMGYKDLLGYFTEREEFLDLKTQVDELNRKLAASEQARGTLLVTVQQLKDELANPRKPRKMNYIVDSTPLIVHGTEAAVRH